MLNPALFSASPQLQGDPARGWSWRDQPPSRRHILLASTQVSAAHLPRGSFPGFRTPFVSIFDLPTQAHFVEFGTEGILRPMQRALRNRDRSTKQDWSSQFRPVTKTVHVPCVFLPFPNVPVSLLARQTFRSLKRKASLPQRILFPFGNQ
uniref:Uncharacterized protein n=1 Tax=Myotis myotis TaxID=51298 RepID=A0A7J7V410_MYOMY|nr:hypothetical protein mMyoMyo1_008508 [Myotis myotis]